MILLFACTGTSEEQSNAPDHYYGLKKFITGQIELLNRQKPAIYKRMVVGGEQEIRRTNDVNWTRELELFMQADLNKPAYRLSYTTARPDSLTYIYTLRPGEDLPVRYLQVVLDKASSRPVLIRARLLAKNKLYESEKELLLRCAEKSGNWRVLFYEIKGFQELVIGGRKIFSVKVKIE